MIASVAPFDAAASNRSTRRWSRLTAIARRSGLSRSGHSRQFGRASAPMIPQRVQTVRGPNVGTGTWSGHGSALRIARWWHSQHDRSSDRTPKARMLPRVIGGPACDGVGWLEEDKEALAELCALLERDPDALLRLANAKASYFHNAAKEPFVDFQVDGGHRVTLPLRGDEFLSLLPGAVGASEMAEGTMVGSAPASPPLGPKNAQASPTTPDRTKAVS
jgi:hypothetical protein